jgi:hemoglobin
MDFIINKYAFGERPPVSLPSPEFLELLKEEGIRKLVSDHYDLLHQSNIRKLFPPTIAALKIAKKNSADFFVQICGGHPYYNENRGKPVMVKAHSRFGITMDARNTWLECYINVLSKLDLPDEVILSFWNYLNVFSIWMVNTRDEPVSLWKEDSLPKNAAG